MFAAHIDLTRSPLKQSRHYNGPCQKLLRSYKGPETWCLSQLGVRGPLLTCCGCSRLTGRVHNSEAEAQVSGFSGCCHQGFNTREEAERYFHTHSSLSDPGVETLTSQTPDPGETINGSVATIDRLKVPAKPQGNSQGKRTNKRGPDNKSPGKKNMRHQKARHNPTQWKAPAETSLEFQMGALKITCNSSDPILVRAPASRDEKIESKD